MSIRSLLTRHHSRDNLPVMNLRNQIDQLFDDFATFDLAPHWGLRLSEDAMITPKTDVAETDKSYQLHMEMPGVTKEQLRVNLSGNVLTIKGEKKAEKESKEKDYHCVERSYGSYQRAFSLPSNVDGNKISAEFRNGVLTVEIPKTEETVSTARKIEVEEK